MCGVAGIVNLRGDPIPRLGEKLAVMSRLIAHRGPDGDGVWLAPTGAAGLAHRRLSIIDLSQAGRQPMSGEGGLTVTYNGEVYNYIELRQTLAANWSFQSRTDTECILAGYAAHGEDVASHLRGMFAFALWDEKRQRLHCARDRFGVKPFYYAICGDLFVFASEIKALLPFLDDVDTDVDALSEYLTFQYTIGEKTLFRGVRQLLPAHTLTVEDGDVKIRRYWDVVYNIDFDHSPRYFQNRLTELIDESMELHLRGDVPVGAYLSGGIDSSLVYALARARQPDPVAAFHGRFPTPAGYDESVHARAVAGNDGDALHIADIGPDDFLRHIESVIFHLDHPVAGPGSFPQYMVSSLAAKHRKVVLGGQGGDEIFGGYARYLIAYFEQCVKAAIDGTYRNGNFVVTAESIIPNLGVLREYKPLLIEFWRDGLFGEPDDRYFRLVDHSRDIADEVAGGDLNRAGVVESFRAIFNNGSNVRKGAYFDSMSHFDLKCLIPALLHVEDRMSMAHGLESRVPLLDHRLVEFAATIPADVKFRDGHMKHLIKTAYAGALPASILERRDKMGFPVPLTEWFAGDLRDWIHDVFHDRRAAERPYVNTDRVIAKLSGSRKFSRKVWGFLSLELWQRAFHDQAARYRAMIE